MTRPFTEAMDGATCLSLLNDLYELAQTAGITPLGDQIHGAAGKTTPADADEFPISDSAAANVLKKLTWANLRSAISTGLRYTFSTTITDADPGAGVVRFNNATIASVTSIFFDNTEAKGGIDVTSWLDSFDDSLATVRGRLTFIKADGSPVLFTVTGAVTDGTGYRKVAVTHVAGTLPANAESLVVLYQPTPATSTPVLIQVACSDETTALTTGTGKATFRAPYAFTLTGVRASVTTAPTGATLLTVDVNESGVSVLSTKLTFDASEKTTTTAATPAVISDTAIADDAELSIDIDAVGNTIAGAGLKVTLIGTKP